MIAVMTLPMHAYAQESHNDHEHGAEVSSENNLTEPINTMCPVTTDEEVDPAFTAVYNGQTIGFCCRKCRTRFERDPEAYLSELPMLKQVSQEVQTDPVHGDLHDHAVEEMIENAHEHDEHGDDELHDHATDHDQGESKISKLISWIGKFHPPATHLPIGMLIGAALAEGLFLVTKRDMFRHAGTFCISLGALGAVSAATLGWLNGGFVLVDDDWVQLTHRWLGTGTALMTLLTLALLIRASKKSSKPASRLWYRVSLFSATGLVAATGFFGGALVYGINHYAW